MDDAIKIAGGCQMPGGREQHGSVTIMTTCMHLSKHLAGPGLARGLCNRQRIHICPQSNAPLAGASP